MVKLIIILLALPPHLTFAQKNTGNCCGLDGKQVPPEQMTTKDLFKSLGANIQNSDNSCAKLNNMAPKITIGSGVVKIYKTLTPLKLIQDSKAGSDTTSLECDERSAIKKYFECLGKNHEIRIITDEISARKDKSEIYRKLSENGEVSLEELLKFYEDFARP